jgi:hypothetical protein
LIGNDRTLPLRSGHGAFDAAARRNRPFIAIAETPVAARTAWNYGALKKPKLILQVLFG